MSPLRWWSGLPRRRQRHGYDYQDAEGNLVFTVIRGPGEKCRLQAADRTEGMPRDGRGLLYRLPEVIEAARQGMRIGIVEREQDVDRLAELSITATCNALGAGKWTQQHVRHLPEGCKVVVMGGADLPGVEHMARVAISCQAAGHDTLILSPEALGFSIEQAHGKSVSDWLDEGHGGDLQRMGSKAVPLSSGPP